MNDASDVIRKFTVPRGHVEVLPQAPSGYNVTGAAAGECEGTRHDHHGEGDLVPRPIVHSATIPGWVSGSRGRGQQPVC